MVCLRYPVSSQPRPEPPRPPATLRAAVVLMLVGAAASLGAAIATAATKGALRRAFEQSPAHPTGTALTSATDTMTIMAVAAGSSAPGCGCSWPVDAGGAARRPASPGPSYSGWTHSAC